MKKLLEQGENGLIKQNCIYCDFCLVFQADLRTSHESGKEMAKHISKEHGREKAMEYGLKLATAAMELRKNVDQW